MIKKTENEASPNSVPVAVFSDDVVSQGGPLASESTSRRTSDYFRYLQTTVHHTRYPALYRPDEQTKWNLVALQVADDLVSDVSLISHEALSIIRNNFLYVPEDQHSHFIESIEQVDKKSFGIAPQLMVIRALGSMLSYFNKSNHATAVKMLLGKTKMGGVDILVAVFESLQMARFNDLEAHVQGSTVDMVFGHVLDASTKVRLAARKLLGAQINHLTAEHQKSLLRRVDDHLYEDWQTQSEMVSVIRDVFIEAKPIHITENQISKGIGTLLSKENWNTVAQTLTLIESNPRAYVKKYYVDKILECCRDKRAQVAAPAIKALVQIALASTTNQRRYMIDALGSTEENSYDTAQKIRGLESLVELAKVVSGFHQIVIAGQLSSFIGGDSDSVVNKRAIDLTQELILSFKEDQPWQAARMESIMMLGVDKPAHSFLRFSKVDKSLQRSIREFLKPQYANVTQKNYRRVLSLLESMLLKTGNSAFNVGLLAAKEVAPQMQTLAQQTEMTQMIDRVSSLTNTGNLLHSLVLNRMPHPSPLRTKQVGKGFWGRTGNALVSPIKSLVRGFFR